MNRQGFVIGLVVAAVSCGFVGSASAQMSVEAQESVAIAEKAVADARASIETAQQLLATIPEDSPMMVDVANVVKIASDSWKVVVGSLDGAQKSAAKIQSAKSEGVAADFALLAQANSSVAVAGADVVRIAIAYVDAVANEKTESIELIKGALENAGATFTQIQSDYDRMKNLIKDKYSK